MQPFFKKLNLGQFILAYRLEKSAKELSCMELWFFSCPFPSLGKCPNVKARTLVISEAIDIFKCRQEAELLIGITKNLYLACGQNRLAWGLDLPFSRWVPLYTFGHTVSLNCWMFVPLALKGPYHSWIVKIIWCFFKKYTELLFCALDNYNNVMSFSSKFLL